MEKEYKKYIVVNVNLSSTAIDISKRNTRSILRCDFLFEVWEKRKGSHVDSLLLCGVGNNNLNLST